MYVALVDQLPIEGLIIILNPSLYTVAPLSIFLSTGVKPTYIGRNVSVTCTIMADAFTDVDIIPTIYWMVTYFNGEVPMTEMIRPTSSDITTITPLIYSTSLDFSPITRDMTLKCFGSIRPAQPSLTLLMSEESNNTFSLIAQGRNEYVMILCT